MDDDTETLLLVVVTSWPFVYFIMTLPLLLLAANFVFGSCTVASYIDGDDEAAEAPRQAVLRQRWRGRAALACVVLALAWQAHAVQAIVLVAAPATSRLFHAGATAVVFAALARCVLSRPHVPAAAAADIPFCRRCARRVPGMDHHCVFVYNCIGAHNRAAFVLLLASAGATAAGVLLVSVDAVVAASHTLTAAAAEARWSDRDFPVLAASAEVLIGAIVAAVLVAGAGGLLLFQMWLLGTGQTTLQLLKRRRAAGMKQD
jgi:hypothetical protein